MPTSWKSRFEKNEFEIKCSENEKFKALINYINCLLFNQLFQHHRAIPLIVRTCHFGLASSLDELYEPPSSVSNVLRLFCHVTRGWSRVESWWYLGFVNIDCFTKWKCIVSLYSYYNFHLHEFWAQFTWRWVINRTLYTMSVGARLRVVKWKSACIACILLQRFFVCRRNWQFLQLMGLG